MTFLLRHVQKSNFGESALPLKVVHFFFAFPFSHFFILFAAIVGLVLGLLSDQEFSRKPFPNIING